LIYTLCQRTKRVGMYKMALKCLDREQVCAACCEVQSPTSIPVPVEGPKPCHKHW
jgi:hypothetical protein